MLMLNFVILLPSEFSVLGCAPAAGRCADSRQGYYRDRKLEQLADFAAWFSKLPGFRKKICIAGNHDLTLDKQHYEAASALNCTVPSVQFLPVHSSRLGPY
uniref:Calcineurin-like phosphoesterase domain-containing protein n=1 Tax=Octactis speculum TaxID=3111310 RepID=A0A7S2G2L3_9STRA|mmetsp:Transcript_35697/g.48212  ORF Transcript_35697/g.48212 Transcript_35697/m.48212 type:complete len:101 (+) Transcript_35697:253-555(+)